MYKCYTSTCTAFTLIFTSNLRAAHHKALIDYQEQVPGILLEVSEDV